jgi:hypothetical protein
MSSLVLSERIFWDSLRKKEQFPSIGYIFSPSFDTFQVSAYKPIDLRE